LQKLETDACEPRLTLGLMHRRDLVLTAALEYFVECVQRTQT
jgi:LysR family transcriptional regulator of abg operon